jgi:glycerophosphoryl diester phosphodiesterase
MTASPDVEVIGHGGAGHYFPGNSRQSLECALGFGVNRIEFDVQLSSDGDLVLVHDDRLRLPTGQKRPVRSLPTSQIRSLLPGLLTFDEAVELIGTRATMLIDVKFTGYHDSVAAAIRRHKLDTADTIASSTHASVLRHLRQEVPDLRTGISTGHMANSFPIKPARALISGALQFAVPSLLALAVRTIDATDVMIQHRACSPRLVRLMHDRGIRVNAWTVDSTRQMSRVIAMGVDSVTSNRPDILLQLIDRP